MNDFGETEDGSYRFAIRKEDFVSLENVEHDYLTLEVKGDTSDFFKAAIRERSGQEVKAEIFDRVVSKLLGNIMP